MKINRTTAYLSLAAIILVICVGTIIGITQSSNTEPTVDTGITETPLDARAVYTDAVLTINTQTNLSISSDYTQNVTVGNEVFTSETQRTLKITGQGSDKMNALGSETLTVGDHSITFTNGYTNGTAYITADGKQFHSEMSAKDFLISQTPAVLMDEALYECIEADNSENGLILTFSQATAGENWAMPDGAVFISADGTAVLDEQMRLIESSYTLRYTDNGVNTEKVICSNVRYSAEAFTVPVQENSQAVSSPVCIRILELACGYLMQADTISADITENILCEAYGDSRVQSTHIDMNGTGTNCIANIDIETTLSNTGKADAPTQKNQKIRYVNSQYTQYVDGAEMTLEEDITPYMMKTYCQDYFLSTLILSKHITSASVSEDPYTYRYDFTANDDFTHSLLQSASQILYQDPTLLFTLSESYTVESMTAYLTIDKISGLPVSTGIACNVSHTVEDFSYKLQYEIRQNYIIPSLTAEDLG